MCWYIQGVVYLHVHIRGIIVHVDILRRAVFVDVFPHFIEAHSGLETVAGHQGHGDMRYYGPGPDSVEPELQRIELGTAALEPADDPHGQVGDQQEGDELLAGLVGHVLLAVAPPLPCVQHQDRLADGLHRGGHGGHDAHQRPALVALLGEVLPDDLEDEVEDEAGLSDQQHDVFQLQMPPCADHPHVLEHVAAHQDRERGQHEDHGLPHIHLQIVHPLRVLNKNTTYSI